MIKVDFYILSDTHSLPLVCRLLEKAHQQKHQVYVQTKNQQEAEQLDQLLWTYRDDSFMPHALVSETLPLPPPIQIGFNTTPQDHRDILVNLSEDVPVFYPQFTRILEVVSGDPEQQSKARDRFRIYRENNCDITTHKI